MPPIFVIFQNWSINYRLWIMEGVRVIVMPQKRHNFNLAARSTKSGEWLAENGETIVGCHPLYYLLPIPFNFIFNQIEVLSYSRLPWRNFEADAEKRCLSMFDCVLRFQWNLCKNLFVNREIGTHQEGFRRITLALLYRSYNLNWPPFLFKFLLSLSFPSYYPLYPFLTDPLKLYNY